MRLTQPVVNVLGMLTLFSCTGADRSLPPLPPEPAGLAPAIREQFRKAYLALQAKPADAEANGRLGMLYHSYRRFEPAAICYRRARIREPRSFSWVYYLGKVQADWGQPQEAIAAFQAALRLRSDYVPARVELADLLLAAGRFDESRNNYEQALRDDPNSASAYYGLGRLHTARTDHPSALRLYRKACELAPKFGAAYYGLALSHRSLGDAEEAQRQMDLYRRHRDGLPTRTDPLMDSVDQLNISPVVLAGRGANLAVAGRIEEAAGQYLRALEVDPRYEPAHTGLVEAYWKQGLWQKAEEHYRAAIALNPDSALARFHFARILHSQSKYSEAERLLARTLEIDPNLFEAHLELGAILEHRGRGALATRHYRAAVGVSPGDRNAEFLLGRRLLIEGSNGKAIEHLLRTLVPEDEKTPMFMGLLSSAYARIGNRERAGHYARRALQLASALGQQALVSQLRKDLDALERASR